MPAILQTAVVDSTLDTDLLTGMGELELMSTQALGPNSTVGDEHAALTAALAFCGTFAARVLARVAAAEAAAAILAADKARFSPTARVQLCQVVKMCGASVQEVGRLGADTPSADANEFEMWRTADGFDVAFRVRGAAGATDLWLAPRGDSDAVTASPTFTSWKINKSSDGWVFKLAGRFLRLDDDTQTFVMCDCSHDAILTVLTLAVLA